MLTLQEYNIMKAKSAIESGVYNKVYSNIYHKHIDINSSLTDLPEEDREKIIRAKENLKELQAIAEGVKLSDIYTLYYNNVYLKEQSK